MVEPGTVERYSDVLDEYFAPELNCGRGKDTAEVDRGEEQNLTGCEFVFVLGRR